MRLNFFYTVTALLILSSCQTCQTFNKLTPAYEEYLSDPHLKELVEFAPRIEAKNLIANKQLAEVQQYLEYFRELILARLRK